MYKVMIVDDEQKALDRLRGMVDFSSHGFEIVCEARSGTEGLENFAIHRPDLVITDIVMPGMSGLAMAEKILQQYGDCIFLLLSSYDDFEYAQQAISLGVFSYILKHKLNGSSLSGELTKAANTLVEFLGRCEQTRWEEFFQISLNHKSYTSQQLQSAFENLLTFSFPAESNRAFAFSLSFDAPVDIQEYWKQSKFMKSWIHAQQQELDVQADLLSLYNHGATMLLILPITNSRSKVEQILLDVCLNINILCEQLFARNVCIGVSPSIPAITDIPVSFKQAEYALTARFFKPSNYVFFYNRLGMNDQSCPKQRELTLTALQDALSSRDYDAAHRCLDTLFLELHALMSDMEKYNEDIAQVAELFYRYLHLGVAAFYQQVSHCGNINEALTAITRLLENYRSQSRYSPKVQVILEYIHDNISENLSLNDIADQVGMSRVYVCQMFKKEMGISFKSYLMEQRIKMAEEMLKTRKYKTYEVAEMVGYQTLQHFSNSFKKVTGRSPGQYIR